MAKFIGRQAHVRRLKRLSGAEADRKIGRALFVGGELIQTEAQLSISRGAVSGKNHVASAPGEAPNNDTSVLANNIETVQKSPTVVEVSSNATYSAPLEFGSSRMEARPFMRPARDAKRQEVYNLVAGVVLKLSKGSA